MKAELEVINIDEEWRRERHDAIRGRAAIASVIGLVIVAVMLVAICCAPTKTENTNQAVRPVFVGELSHKQSVWIFPLVENFGKQLVNFSIDHPDQRVVSTAVNLQGSTGRVGGQAGGYWVVTERDRTEATIVETPKRKTSDVVARFCKEVANDKDIDQRMKLTVAMLCKSNIAIMGDAR